jgi:hypothetical protein
LAGIQEHVPVDGRLILYSVGASAALLALPTGQAL